jgi:hypothetical protein
LSVPSAVSTLAPLFAAQLQQIISDTDVKPWKGVQLEILFGQVGRTPQISLSGQVCGNDKPGCLELALDRRRGQLLRRQLFWGYACNVRDVAL